MTPDLERETLHVSDDTGRIALIDTRTDDTPIEQLVRYQYSDHLSTATLELDAAGAVISYEEYYPYGSTSFQSGRSAAEVSLKCYRYTGKERDEESGLYYHGARYYVPWLARWTAVDPLESKYAGMSPYNYSFNNPVMFNDPSGMEGEDTIPTIAAPTIGDSKLGLGTSKATYTFTTVSYDSYHNFLGKESFSTSEKIDSLEQGEYYREKIIPNRTANRDGGITYGNLETTGNYELIARYGEPEVPQTSVSSGLAMASAGILSFITADVAIPEPSDVLPHKWLGYVALAAVAVGMQQLAEQLESEQVSPLPEIRPLSPAVKEQEPEQKYETFYRAMSNKEYETTGGYLQHRLNEKGDYKGAGPFITDRYEYALGTQEFGTGKYDMMIEYTVPKGTKEYLTAISLKHPMDNITKVAISNSLPVMKLEKLGYNFGFPGQAGNVHFNNRIISMKKINFK